MDFKFYVQMDGEAYGPYSVKEIIDLDLPDDVLVTEESLNGEWIPAGQFKFEDLLKNEQKPEVVFRSRPSSSAQTGRVSRTTSSSSNKNVLKWIAVLVVFVAIGAGVISLFKPSPTPTLDPSRYVIPTNDPPKGNQQPTTPSTNGGGNEAQQQISDNDIVTCYNCKGTGVVIGSYPILRCGVCNGRGQMTAKEMREKLLGEGGNSYNGGGGNVNNDWPPCPHCHGSGKCPDCGGRGEKSYGSSTIKRDCYDCHGSGQCQMCLGKGVYIH